MAKTTTSTARKAGFCAIPLIYQIIFIQSIADWIKIVLVWLCNYVIRPSVPGKNLAF